MLPLFAVSELFLLAAQQAFLILGAGLFAGIICRWLKIPLLVGYLVIGVIIGDGALNLMEKLPYHTLQESTVNVDAPTDTDSRIAYLESEIPEQFAHLGALLLLFSIGIDLSPSELRRIGFFAFLGGTTQMFATALPVAGITLLLGGTFPVAILVGFAVALSSTVLVFKSLEEYGETTSPLGKRLVGVLLYQDAAIVPLLLLVPMLAAIAQGGNGFDSMPLLWLVVDTSIFVASVWLLRHLFTTYGVPFFAKMRSVELLVLLTVVLLIGVCLIAYSLEFPAAIAAFATGVVLCGTRLTRQIEALILPFRETFAAIFFVSLGTLLRFDVLFEEPLTTLGIFVGVLLIKGLAAAVAMRALGLKWHNAIPGGFVIAQMGELSFILLAVNATLINETLYQQLLFTAVCSLVLTPLLAKVSLARASFAQQKANEAQANHQELEKKNTAKISQEEGKIPLAVIIGTGPIGTQAASFLETHGFELSLVDRSLVNLHRHSQLGFHTVAGDATELSILLNAGIHNADFLVITIPDDTAAMRIVTLAKKQNPRLPILVRCRYQANVQKIRKSGATRVVSEEVESGQVLVRIMDELL